MNAAKFELGRLVSTPNALAQVSHEEIIASLSRHVRGDWGDCCPDDRAANDAALLDGTRLLSVYHTTNGTKFRIITEWDRSVTTVLLPEDY
jgi:hypothetical protein